MEICIIVTTEFSDDDNTYFMERRYRDTEMFLKTLGWWQLHLQFISQLQQLLAWLGPAVLPLQEKLLVQKIFDKTGKNILTFLF